MIPNLTSMSENNKYSAQRDKKNDKIFDLSKVGKMTKNFCQHKVGEQSLKKL